jgi:hypothetical protein
MTARDKYTKELSENPRWKEAPHTGQATVIVGARPWKLPANCVDVTSENLGKPVAIIGAEAFRAKVPDKS